MQFPASRSAASIQRFKELHICRHNDRSIPIFRCQQRRGPFVVTILLQITMMLHHILRSENIPEHGSRLYNNTRIRNNDDNPFFFVTNGVEECPSHRRQCLSPTCRNCQAKKAGKALGHLPATGQDSRPFLIDERCWCICRKRFHIDIKPILQRFHRIILPTPGCLFRMHKPLRIQVVGINQAREQHANPLMYILLKIINQRLV